MAQCLFCVEIVLRVISIPLVAGNRPAPGQHRLRELRRRRLWTEPLHWTVRVATLKRFGGEEELGRQMQREFEERRAEVLSARSERRSD